MARKFEDRHRLRRRSVTFMNRYLCAIVGGAVIVEVAIGLMVTTTVGNITSARLVIRIMDNSL